MAHALLWTGGAKWLSQLASWLAMIVVARLLTPEDFGLVGMAQIFLGLVAILSEFGLATAIVAHPDLSEEHVAQLNSVAVMVGVGALILTCMAAVPLGRFFMAPQLPSVVVATSSVFVITAFRTVPNAVLQKELRFRFIATTEALQAIAAASAMLALAMLGFHYWSMVLSTVLGALVASVLTMLGRPCAFRSPDFGRLASVLRASRYLLLSRLAWWFQTNVDRIIIGRVLGKGPLGAYTFASSVASLPLEKITALVNQVSPPYLAAARDDRAALSRLLLTLTGVLAIVVFPVAAGLAIVAERFVLVFLGSKWTESILPLQLLAILAALRSIVAVLAPVVVVAGATRLFMYVSVIEAVGMTVVFYLGSAFGVTGIAAAWLALYPVVRLPFYWWVFRRLEITPAQYLRELWPASRATGLMVLGVVAAERLLPMGTAPVRGLITQVGVGIVVYAAASLAQRRRLLETYRNFRLLGREAS